MTPMPEDAAEIPGDEFPEDASGSITILYQQWRQGQVTSLGELIERFRPRLIALARSTLGGRLARLPDDEDAMQSAMVSFWEQVEQGQFNENLDRDDLWNLLGLMTVRKALKLVRRERTQKRGGGAVVGGLPLEELPGADRAGHAGDDVGLDVHCAELLELLDDDVRPFALLRLMGYKNHEIATQMECTERKVERKLQLVRAIWEDEMQRWRD
ncbi:MAG: hypothetical protein JSS02_17310 [Planctomycetes bacterium]|nr:hypothetical protein [Planctomycetota bacterium]